jgi:hypothetical protein
MVQPTQTPEQNSEKLSYDFASLDAVCRKWAVMSQFEQDLENYDQLKQQLS